ncbi:unnamed protein product [Alternaria alternata]
MRGRTVFAVLVGLVVTAVEGFVPTRRQTSTSFAGSNEYFLHALSASEQKTYIETLAGWGAKVIRLWACDAYCQKYTDASTFYSSTEAKADYDKRLEKILNYQSPNFGEAWKSLNQVIMAFDLQNEPLIKQLDKLNNNDPDDWLCGRAGVMRNALGSSDIKIATGGIGGSHYCCDHEFNTLEKAMQCDAIDIISMHGYMSKASDWAYYITGDKEVLSGARAAGKNIMMEEWGVSTDFQDSFDTQAQIFNDAGVPWLYWQFVPGLDGSEPGAPTGCGYDGFEIGLDSPKGDAAGAIAAANAATAAQSWANYLR